MLIRSGARLAVALVCAAAIVASLIARDSRVSEQRAFEAYIDKKDSRKALRLLDDAEALNPDFALDVARARLERGRAVAILTEAVRREPENAELWLRLAQHQVLAGRRGAARRSYARARELAPLLPPEGPPPGT